MRPGDVWDKTEFVSSLLARTDTWKWKTAGGYRSGMRSGMASAVRRLAVTLDNQPGWSVQDRWGSFETKVWPRWHAGEGRSGEDAWRWGTWAAVLTRTVQPSWEFIDSRVAARVRRIQGGCVGVVVRDYGAHARSWGWSFRRGGRRTAGLTPVASSTFPTPSHLLAPRSSASDLSATRLGATNT